MARYIQHDLMKNLKQVVNLRIILMLFFLILMKINISFFSFLNLEINKIYLTQKKTSAVILLTKVVPRSLPLGNNQGTEISQKLTIIYNYIVARYGCVQKILQNNMLTARINPLTVCFILCLAIEATYEPEFCFSLFLIGGGGANR